VPRAHRCLPSIFPAPSRLFRNLGGRFAEVANAALNQETWAIRGKVVDFDGWQDLVLCSDKASTLRTTTHRNNSGRFEDVTGSTAYKGLRTRESDLADVNGDGRPDLLTVEDERFPVWLSVGGRYPAMGYSRPLNLGRDLAVDGNGASFHVSANPLPRASQGDTDVVTAIPNWRGTGRAAFLVSNGKWGASGPYQLIVFSAS
jgi:hypothetical protein